MTIERDLSEQHFAHLDRLSPEGNSFGFHVRYSRPLIQRSTYPEAWNARYSEKAYIIADPSVIWGMTNKGTLRWSEVQIPDTLGVFPEAASFGLRYGVIVATGEQDSKSFGSCARGDREFTDAEIDEIEDLIISLHHLFGSQGSLKSHQIDALRMLAAGMTYDEACEKLGISRTALRNRLAGARRALGAETNSEAVRLAIEKGQLETGTYTGMAKGLPTP